MQETNEMRDRLINDFAENYMEKLFYFCLKKTGSNIEAEDLTQETFVNFFAKLSDYRHKGKTKNFLYTIAGNLCKNYYKQHKPISIDEEQLSEMESTSGNPEENITDRVMLEWALEQLPEEFRQVIDLYYFQEMKLTEIASALGIGLPLVKYRLKQARTRLQVLLGKEEAVNESG